MIFTNAGVLDGAEALQAGMTVVVEGCRIATVSKESVEPGADDQIIDLGGKTLMPGMITAHAHIERGQPKDGPEGVMMAVAMKNCRSMLDGGFTGMVSAGSAFGIDQQLQICMRSGLIQGPRVKAGSVRINTTGFVNDKSKWWEPLVDTPMDVYGGAGNHQADFLGPAQREKPQCADRVIYFIDHLQHPFHGGSV